MESNLADQRILTAMMAAAEPVVPAANASVARPPSRWMVDLRTARVVRRIERESCPGTGERTLPGAGW
ncbi:MAG: hypothetical protein HY875_04210 [Chloroflexi bacterium]|nr:hypothetical protein [Chloroflexota bacterium]